MHSQNPVLSVSQLNRQVKSFLENEVGTVHVEGEISNLSKPSSGHYYFTLKDAGAQLRCVFFKNRHIPPLSKTLCDGQKLVASGKLSLYEARGDYQLIVEQLAESGLGELYQQFEALKNKLAAEGLFLPAGKKPLPNMPQTIGIITSPSGAAIRDMLSTLARRFPLAQIFIYPSEVQGATAAQQLIKALHKAQTDKRCEVLILARGGGSMEDLWAFNDEQLARSIAACTIPIVSGVGHETDFTIADFVADYRAETPTAAATAVTPDAWELLQDLHQAIDRMHKALVRKTQTCRLTLQHLQDKLASPRQAISAYWQTLDYLERQLHFHARQNLQQKKHQLHLNASHLSAMNPKTRIATITLQIHALSEQLTQQIKNMLGRLQLRMQSNLSTLHAVSPLATLDRGYAIASKDDKIVLTSADLKPGDTIAVRLAKGALTCDVIQIIP